MRATGVTVRLAALMAWTVDARLQTVIIHQLAVILNNRMFLDILVSVCRPTLIISYSIAITRRVNKS